MAELSITMNGEQATVTGAMYIFKPVKHMTPMYFVCSFKDYGKTDFTLEKPEFANEISMSGNFGNQGNFEIKFTFIPNKSQMSYLLRFKVKENNTQKYIFINFNCLATAYPNCNQGYIASSNTFDKNGKLTFDPKIAFIPGQWGNGQQLDGWTSVGRAFGNALYKPVSLVGTVQRVARTLINRRHIDGEGFLNNNSLWVEVTFSEKTVDEMKITEHPVENGSVIADHIVRMPATYTIKAGFSGNGTIMNTIKVIGNVIKNWSEGNFVGPNLLKTQYNQLLSLQRSKSLFKITTPKRVYKNMAIQTLTVETDVDTESVLNFTAVCKEVQMASASIIDKMLDSVTDQLEINPLNEIGTQSTSTVNQSLLKQINGLF